MDLAQNLAQTLDVPAFSSTPALMDAADVVCIATATMDHFLLAETCVRAGKHVFLEWPATTSIQECEMLVRLAEEAGVEVGVSAPQRFHPVVQTRPKGWHPTWIGYQGYGFKQARWPHRLAEVIDLCTILAGSNNIRRMEGHATHAGPVRLDTVSFGLRFHNGTYAQASIRRYAPNRAERVSMAGGGYQLEADLITPRAALRHVATPPNAPTNETFEPLALADTDPLNAEVDAFLKALCQRRPCPVSILEALYTMRHVERLLTLLR